MNEIAEQEDLVLEALELSAGFAFEENSLLISYGENVALIFDRYQVID